MMIEVTRDAAGYTFVTATREDSGLKSSVSYRAKCFDDTTIADVVTARDKAIREVNRHFSVLGACDAPSPFEVVYRKIYDAATDTLEG